MPVQLEVEFPDENTLTLSDKFLRESSGGIVVRGRGNRLTIEDPLIPGTARFVLNGGASIWVKKDSNLNALSVHALVAGVQIEIGAWASFHGACLITAHEISRIRVGNFCLFGDNCRIMSSDVHKIVDMKTGERLNPGADIEIGDHVWVAPNTMILRNARIGRDSVVGLGSLVNKAFPPNSSLAGVPARVVREGINWEF